MGQDPLTSGQSIHETDYSLGIAACVTTGAFVSPSSMSVAEYKHSLNDEAHNCSVYSSSQLDIRLREMAADQARGNYGSQPDESASRDQNADAAKTFAACKTAAKKKGMAEYQAFVQSRPAAKQDAKAVLIAWFAFLGVARNGTDDYKPLEWNDYRKALATLEVDVAGA